LDPRRARRREGRNNGVVVNSIHGRPPIAADRLRARVAAR
jgi:hypothetical protein